MATYTWTIPTGNIINGSTYIKDTDNKIQDTIDDLADFVNSSGSYANQGLMFDYVNKASNQTITGIKTFSNGLIGNVTGNVTGTSTKLATARTITLAGDVTGSVSFDGSANTSMTTTVGDNSHSHTIANVTGLQTALDGKLSTSGNAATATTAATATNATNATNAIYAIYATTQTAGTNNTTIATTAFVMANSSNTLADLGVTATAAELNKLDGVTATATHLNYINTLSSNAQTQLNGKANLASPSLTGAPTAPTPTTGDDSTRIATTAYVRDVLSPGRVLGTLDFNGSTMTITAKSGIVTGVTRSATGTYAISITSTAAYTCAMAHSGGGQGYGVYVQSKTATAINLLAAYGGDNTVGVYNPTLINLTIFGV